MNQTDEHPPVTVTRRRVLQLVGGTLAVAVTSHAFNDVQATNAPPSETDPDPVGERRYRGTATTTVGDARVADGVTQRSVHRDIVVTVGPSVTSDGGPANPFELTVEGPIGRASAVGPGRIVTAEVGFGAEGRPDAGVKHWDVQAGDDGVFSGVLRESDAEANVLTSRRELIPGHEDTMLLVTEAMAGGATLAGVITAERLELDVSGNTVNRFADDLLDRTRPFASEIRATRER